MERTQFVQEMKSSTFQNFQLPEDFSIRLQELEISLYEGSLNHNNLKELFELYSVKILSKHILTYFKSASSHYEALGLMDEFKFYIQKMQKLLKNDKIQPLLTRRKSQKLVQQFSLSVEEKRDKIDKIKSLIKENKREVNSKEIANQYLQEINKQENQNKAEIIMKEDIINQEESFKKRLEEKRLLRGNSQPHMKLKVKNKKI